MDNGRDVSASDHSLNSPWGPTAGAVPPTGPIETSVPAQTTKGGGDKVKDCGECPACKANAYLKEFGPVVTEIAHMGEGVWIGPDKESFNSETFHYIGSVENGIAALAIEADNAEAWAWYEEQITLQILAKAGLL